MAENDNIKLLYDELKDTYDVGSEDDFRKYLSDGDNREALRKELSNEYDVGDSASFSQYLGFDQEAVGKTDGNTTTDAVVVDGNEFTESQLEAVRQGAQVVQRKGFGTPEYANEVIADDIPGNPYVGMTRQQAVNAIGEKYRNEWYGKPGAYQNIQKELADYNIASPSDYGHITAAIRNHQMQTVARQRVEQLLSPFKNINGMTFDDVQAVMDSRETQRAISEDVRNLGMEQEDRDTYYQELENQLEKVLTEKYGYLPGNDGRSRVRMMTSSLMNGGSHFHEERIREREAMNMMQEYLRDDIDATLSDYDRQAQEVKSSTLESTGAENSLPGGGNAGMQLGSLLLAQRESNKAKDPDKILKDLTDRSSELFDKMLSNEAFLAYVVRQSEALGIEPDQYVADYVIPSFMKSMQREFSKTMVARELPKGRLDYIMRGLTDDSIIGMLVQKYVMTDSQIQYRDMANAKYGEGANIWLQGARMATGMASDFWLWGGWGKIGGAATRSLLNQRILSLAATKHITREAATRILEEEAKQYLSKGMFEHIMRHVPQSAVTMGGAEATTEAVRGYTRNEEIGDILLNTFKSAMSGAATGTAFGVTGGAASRLTSQLSGVKRLAGKLAGLEVEAATLYTTEELQKMLAGDDAFENPFEGMFEANVKLGFIKASANPLETARKFVEAVAHPVKAVKGMMTPEQKVLTEEDVADLRDSFDGQGLVDAITTMRPVRYTDSSEREGYIKEEKAAIAAQAYNEYMSNPDRPIDRKQRVARLLGGIVPPTGKEVRIDVDTTDGKTVLRTRDIDGQCVQELHFDSHEEAEAKAKEMAYEIDQNTTAALHQKIDMYDSFDRLDRGIEEVYARAAEKIQQGEELTEEEQKAVYLRQNKARLLDLTVKTNEGQPLTEEEQKLADIFEGYFIRFVQEGAASKAFLRDYEQQDGLQPNVLERAIVGHSREEAEKMMEQYLPEKSGQESNLIPIGNDRYRTQEEAEMVARYQQALRDHIAEKEAVGKINEHTEQTEGRAGGEAGADGTGGNEPPAGPADTTSLESEGNAGGSTAGGTTRPAADAAGTVAGVQRNERRQAAYDRGKQSVQNPASLAAITYENHLASLRLLQLFPENDPVLSRLRKDLMKAVSEGNDEEADRLLNLNAGNMNSRQKEAVEQYRDAMELSRGVDDAVTEAVQAFQRQRHDELKKISAADGTVTELTLADGSKAYYIAGDPENKYNTVIVADEQGNTRMLSGSKITAVGERVPMETILRADVDAYGQQLEQELSGYASGTSIVPGSTVDLGIGSYLVKMQYVGNDAAGNMIFKEADGRQSVFTPQDVQQFVLEANRMKMEAQLRQEKTAAVEQAKTDRFGKGIVGYNEGRPDVSHKDSDVKTVAEYLESSLSSGETAGHTALLKSIQGEIDKLNELAERSRETVRRMAAKQELQGLSEQEEIALGESQAAIDDAAGRRRKWGEIRQAMMTDEERRKFEGERQKEIKKAMDAVKDIPAGKPLDTLAVPTGKELLEQYEEQGDAENAVETLRANLKAQYRDDVYPRLASVREAIEDYRRGLRDLTADELKELAARQQQLDAQEMSMKKQSQELGKLANSLGRLYAGRNKQQLTPHEYKMQQLEKETNKAKKLNLAKEAFKEDEEALAVLDDLEPQDVYEHIADNLGPGSINWEGIQQGEHYARGLRDELGRDKVRGIGRGSDTIGFNYFLAPEGQGKDIETIVHKIAEGSNYGTEDVKNALIDMLTSASKPTDISHRIIDERIARAEEIYEANREREREAEEEAKREALDNEIMQMTGMTPEEYDAYISDLESRLAEQEGYRTSEDYYNQTVEQYEREQERNAGGSQETGALGLQGQEGEQGTGEGAVEEGAGAADAIAELQTDVNDFTSKYNSLPAEVISLDIPDAELIEKLGIPQYVIDHFGSEQEACEAVRNSLKEKKTVAAYNRESNKIIIFATAKRERIPEAMFHENVHGVLRGWYGDKEQSIATNFWNLAPDEGSKIDKSYIQKRYDEDEWKTEFFVTWLGRAMVDGTVEDMLKILSDPGDFERVNNILTAIGYDRAKETAERQGSGRLAEDNSSADGGRPEEGEVDAAGETDGHTEAQDFSARLAEAKAETNTNPTEEQKKAGNYKMGHISFGGYRMSIENPKGSTRSGKDANGKAWSIQMQDSYGYIGKKYGTDGDHLDFFINDDADLDNWNGRVYVVDQGRPAADAAGVVAGEQAGKPLGTLEFDEHKVMYGYPSFKAAKEAYERNYEAGWWDSHVMQMTGVRKDTFDKWLEDSDHKRKPFAEYSRTKNAETITDNVDQLLADVRERAMKNVDELANVTSTYREGELAKHTISELEHLKEKRKKDASMARYSMKAFNIPEGSEKEHTLKMNEAKAKADIKAIDVELKRRLANIDFMIDDIPDEEEKTGINSFVFGNKVVSLQSQEAREAVDGQKATLAPTAPWREGVEDVVVHTSLPTIRKKYADLHEKAKAGDVEAAVELVANVVKPEKVKAIVEQHPNARVAYVHAEEATGRNQIPVQYANQFRRFGLPLTDIVQTNKPAHTGSDRVGRFIRRARFDGDVESGAEYVIVDDHVTMGSTLRDLKDYIESKGGKVVAVSTLTASAGGTKLRPTEEQIKKLNEKGITNEQLRELGIADSTDGLTRREAAEILVLADKGGDTGTSRGREENAGRGLGADEEALRRPADASDEGSIDVAQEASIVGVPRINDYGLNVNTPIGRKLSRLKSHEGEKTLAGFTDSETGDMIFLGNDARTIDESIKLKEKQTGTIDGMPSLTVPFDDLDIITPVMVKKGYKMAITDDKIDAVDTMLDEVDRRKEVAKKRAEKEADKAEAKSTIDEYLKEREGDSEDTKARKRATKAELKVMKDAGVPYHLADEASEKKMLKLFSMFNEEAVKAFARKPSIRNGQPHGIGRYCVYNMEDPFAVPMYAEKLSVAQEILEFMKKSKGSWKILDIGWADETAEMPEELREAANFQAMMGWHGSGALFTYFDHSHMGEGEGSQSFGWGTYITDSKGVGRGYAKRQGDSKVSEKAFIESKIAEAKRFNIPAQIAYWENELERKNLSNASHYLYRIEIPDETEAYYLDYKGKMGDQKDIFEMVDNGLSAEGWKRQEIDTRIRFTKDDKQIILTPNQSGADLYEELKEALGGAKEASQWLNDLGVTGIKYPAGTIMGGGDGATNYVIFNEDDAKIVDTIQFQAESNGILGWSDNTGVTLTRKGLNPNTPIHECNHLWDRWCMKEQPELWKKVVAAMKKTKMWEDIRRNPNYRSIWNNDDKMASEVKSRLSGIDAEEEFMRAAFKKGTVQSVINEVKSVLRKFWESILRLFGKQSRTVGSEWDNERAIVRMTLRDLLNKDFEKVMRVVESDPSMQAQAHIETDKAEAAYERFLAEKAQGTVAKKQKAIGDVEAPNEFDVAVRDKLIDDYLEPAGIGLYSDAEAEKILEEGKEGVKLSKGKNNAAETAPLIQKEGSPADISTASGAKILKNLESYAYKLEKVVNRRRNFLDEVGHELEASQDGSGSWYKTFVTKDGSEVTIRLGNHNATVNNFDYRGEKEGISIVVSRHGNEKLKGTGKAHVVEFFYPEIALRKAYGHPLADIVRAIKDAAVTGVYKDPTGIAEPEDVNPPKYFKTTDGEVYGFALNGKIGIDRRTAKADTPIHEYGHLWAAALRKVNPMEWENVVRLMKGMRELWDAVKRDYSELKTDDDIAEEVLTQYSGKRGRQRFYEERERVLNDPSMSGDEKVRLFTIFENVKKALNSFWRGVADFLHIHYTSAEQVADQVLGDLLHRVNPTKEAKKYATEEGRIKAAAERDGTYMQAPDGTRSKLSEKEWVAARTEGFKKWIGGDWEAVARHLLSGETAEHTTDESLRGKLDRNGEPQEKYVQGYLERPRKPGKPKKKDSETMAEYFNRLRLYNEAIKYWPETEAQWKAVVYRHEENTLPNETAIHEKWMQKYDEDLKKWKEDNALAPDAVPPVEKPIGDDADPLDYMSTMAEWQRNEALWKTAPDKSDYEREAEAEVYSMLAALELKHHPMSYSSRMRQAGASLKQIRDAVLTQKRYDQATVQSVVDFAKNFMSLGFGDNIGRGDLSSILTSVKRAVGARSIRDSVDGILETLVDNHLRNLSNFLEKMTSVKDKRLNPTGVEVQGELDLEGQRAMSEFRRMRASRMTPDEINVRLNELLDKIMDDPENRSQWEAEYDGAHAALTYAEGIAANKKACVDAENAIRDAEKSYSSSGRTYAAQQELLNSLHRGLSDLLFERIDLYGQLFDELGGILSESRERAKEFREAEKARIFNIHRLAAIDMNGSDANETHPKTWKKSLNNSAPVRLLLSSLGTFEQMMKQFGSRHPNGEGALHNHYMRGFVDASNNEQIGLENAKAMLDAKASEVFGKKMRWSHLYYLERSMPTADVEWLDAEGNRHSYTLSQGNMLAIYMWNKMHDGQMKLRKMGITDDDVMRIKEHIDPRLIELADWVQGEFLPTLRTKYNKVHEQEFGASMAEIENYFPLRIIKDAVQKQDDLTADPNADSVLPSTTTGSIIKRTVNTMPLDILNTDALSLVIEHIEEMEHWAAFTHWNKDVNTLLSYNRFKNQVKNMDTIYGSGDELWDAFRAACQLAAGSYRPKHGKADKAMTVIASGVTGAKIAFRSYTALKQLLSAPAFLYDASAKNYAKYFMNPKNFFHDNFVWAMENLPVLRKRWHSRDMGDTRLSDKTGFGYWHTQTKKWVAQYGMWANGMIDVLTCAAGARAIYETRMETYRKRGMDESKAKEKALQDAAIGYNLTQQSSEGAFVTPLQKDRTLFANMWTVFRNSSMSYTRQSVDAIRNLKRMYSNKSDMLYSLERTFREEEGMSEADAKVAARAEYKRSLWKNMAKLAVCAFVLPWFWELGSKVPYLLFGDDDELKKRMLADVTRKELICGPLEGFTFGNAVNSLWGVASDHNIAKVFEEEGLFPAGQEALRAVSKEEVQPLPMFGDMGTMLQKFGYDEAAGLQDMVNIAVQMGTGVNPQTLTDPIMAAIDYCRGDMTKAKEIELFLMRVIMVPTESTQNIYLDELGMDAKEAQGMSYDELARRYADYRFGKNAPMFGWVYSDEAEKKRRESYMQRVNDDYLDRIGLKSDSALKGVFNRTSELEQRKALGKEIASRNESEDNWVDSYKRTKEGKKKDGLDHKEGLKNYITSRSWEDIIEDMEIVKAKRTAKAKDDDDALKEHGRYEDRAKKLIWEFGTEPYKDNGTVYDDEKRMEELRELRKKFLKEIRKRSAE